MVGIRRVWWMGMKNFLFSPCIECIVSACCSQICEEKKEYDRYLPTVEYVMGNYARKTLEEYERTSILATFGKKK